MWHLHVMQTCCGHPQPELDTNMFLSECLHWLGANLQKLWSVEYTAVQISAILFSCYCSRRVTRHSRRKCIGNMRVTHPELVCTSREWTECSISQSTLLLLAQAHSWSDT